MSNTATLYLDTTSPTLMIGIAIDGQMAFTHNEPSTSQRYHSAILVPSIQRGLQQAGIAASNLTRLAVNIGPGSFTGIRTGLVTIRTMAQVLETPVTPFSTFELLAAEANRNVTVVLDALQGNVYGADVRVDDGLPTVERQGLFAIADFVPAYPPVLAMPKLAAKLEGTAVEVIDEASLFTPAVMHQLLENNPSRPTTPWQAVKPLYLQAPNITMKQTASPRV